MRTQAAVATTKIESEPLTDEDGRPEEIAALSLQVSSAFGELSRVQGELAERMDLFKEREAELAAQRTALEKERDEHETRVARAERIARQAEAREEALSKREEAVGRREQAANAFQDLLARMAAALDDPTPTKLSEALDAATISLSQSHAALGARAAAEAGPDAGRALESEAVAGMVGDGCGEAGSDAGLDLGDFSEEELRKLAMLQKLGTASAAEIAEQIRSERGASDQKKRSWFS